MNHHSVGMRTVSQQIDGVALPVVEIVRGTNAQAALVQQMDCFECQRCLEIQVHFSHPKRRLK
jgi:hypothetical protein